MAQNSIWDVLVIGSGASGLAAAIAAGKRGASVLVVDGDIKPGRKILQTGNGRCNLSNSCIDLGSQDSRDEKCSGRGLGRAMDDVASDGDDGLAPARSPLRFYNNPEFVKPVLTQWGCSDIRRAFAQIGLATYEDSTGKIYPITNKANSVLDVLLNECERLGVTIWLETQIVEVSVVSVQSNGNSGNSGELIVARSEDGRLIKSKTMVLCTGDAEGIPESMGIATIPRKHVLGPLRTNTQTVAKISGVRMRCKISLSNPGHGGGTTNPEYSNDSDCLSLPMEFSGEILFRKYGVSGIVVFEASRFAKIGSKMSIDLLPTFSEESLADDIESRLHRASGETTHIGGGVREMAAGGSRLSVKGAGSGGSGKGGSGKGADNPGGKPKSKRKRKGEPNGKLVRAFDGLLVREVAEAILSYCGYTENSDPAAADAAKIAHALKNLELEITGLPEAGESQVTRGGISCECVNPSTMEVDGFHRIHACGEALDIDGTCGGFNLHWAWASGITSGEHAAEEALQ